MSESARGTLPLSVERVRSGAVAGSGEDDTEEGTSQETKPTPTPVQKPAATPSRRQTAWT
jgi:hypothetical protein